MTLIIGYGNPLRTDDAIGQIIAEALGGIALPQLNPELAEPISRADKVVFIDACYGENAGEIDCERVEVITDSYISHSSNPATLLAAAQDLYGAAPPAYIISITGANFDYGDKLSPQLEEHLPRLKEEIAKIIQEIKV